MSAILQNVEIVLKLSELVSGYLNTTLTDEQNALIVKMISDNVISFININETSMHNLAKYLARVIKNTCLKNKSDTKSNKNSIVKSNSSFDFHEWLKVTLRDPSQPWLENTNAIYKSLGINTMTIDSLFGVADQRKLQRYLSPTAQYKYAFMLFDTDNQDPNLSTDTSFGYNFNNNALLKSGTMNAIGPIKNLVGMRVFPMVANLNATPYLITNTGAKVDMVYNYNSFGMGATNTYPLSRTPLSVVPVQWFVYKYYNNYINVNNNITVLIHEFQAQSFIGRDGRRFHFVYFPQLMNPENVGGVYITPRYNAYVEYNTTGKGDGWFWFKTPIQEFSTLTFSIGTPFDLITQTQNIRTIIPIMFIYLDDYDDEL